MDGTGGGRGERREGGRREWGGGMTLCLVCVVEMVSLFKDQDEEQGFMD